MRESELDSLFLPEGARGAGYKLRRYRGGEDMAAIAEVMNVSWAADSIDANVAPEDIAHILAKTDFFDPVKDTVLLEKDQKLVGFAESYLRPLDDGTQLHPMQVLVLPEERNKGLRHALIGFCEHRAREIAAEHPGDAPCLLEVFSAATNGEWRGLLENEGYSPSWYLYEMVRQDLESIPDLPLPKGVEIRPVRPEDMKKIWDATREAFRDMRNFSERTYTDQAFKLWTESRLCQPRLWQIAWERDEVAGGVHNYIDEEENKNLNRSWGHTERIFVRRRWRNQGMAGALIARSLGVLKAEGVEAATLDVDTENPSRALGVYLRMGYKQEREFVFYRKPVV
jgi:GNAT superfamily N-acetyltransferase